MHEQTPLWGNNFDVSRDDPFGSEAGPVHLGMFTTEAFAASMSETIRNPWC